MITIYNFQRGARGVRIAWLCEEMGLAYRTIILPYPTPADYRARYPLGAVPFLEDDGGVAMAESSAMMLYLTSRYGPTPLLPAEPVARARVIQLVVTSEAALGATMNVLLAAKFGAPAADKRNWSVGYGEGVVSRTLDYIAGLKGDQPYLAGGHFSAADIAIATALTLWEGPLSQTIPEALDEWLALVRGRPACAKAREAFA